MSKHHWVVGLSSFLMLASVFGGLHFASALVPPTQINAPHDDGTGLDPISGDFIFNTNGDWTILSGSNIYFNDTSAIWIIVNGNLTIRDGGRLTLNDVSLYMNSTRLNVSITVESGGTLVINGSTVDNVDEYYNFYVDGDLIMLGGDNRSEIDHSTGVHLNPGSAARLCNSEIFDAYGNGLVIQTDDVITNCLDVDNNYGCGVFVENSAPTLYGVYSYNNELSGFYFVNSPGEIRFPWGSQQSFLDNCQATGNNGDGVEAYNSWIVMFNCTFWNDFDGIESNSINIFLSNCTAGATSCDASHSSVNDIELTDNTSVTYFTNVTFSTVEMGDALSELYTYYNDTMVTVYYPNATPASSAAFTIHNKEGYTLGEGETDVNGVVYQAVRLPNSTYRRSLDSLGEYPWGEYPTLSPWAEERRSHIIVDREEYTIEVSKGDYKSSAYLVDTFTGGVVGDPPAGPTDITMYTHARDVYVPSVDIADVMDTSTDENVSVNITNKGDMNVLNSAFEDIEVEVIIGSQEYYGSFFNKSSWAWEQQYYGYWEPVAFYCITSGLAAGASYLYNFTWNVSYSLPTGYYYLTTFVRITDGGEYNYSNNVYHKLVYINQTDVTPSVSIVSPANMQAFEHGDIPLEVFAYSEYGNITNMWIRFNDGPWDEVSITPGPTVYYSFTSDSKDFTNGVNTMYARVWDGVDDMKVCTVDFVVKDNVDSPRDSCEWTIGIYMNADNSLGAAGFDGRDLQEIKDWAKDLTGIEDVGSNSHANILILKDGPLYNNPPGDDCQLMYIDSAGNAITNSPGNMAVNNVSEVDMCNATTLINFANWMVAWYPAQHYALILWDHGYGWQMAGQDASNGHSLMTMSKLKTALASITNNGRNRLDILGFDECMMGMTEVAYQVSPYVDYMVASERTEPGEGWYYYGFLENLSGGAMTPAELATAIVDSYVDSYDANYQKPGFDPVSGMYVRDYGMAAISVHAKMGLLAMYVDKLAESIDAKVETYSANILTAINETQNYNYGGAAPYYDLYDLAENLRSEVPNASIDANCTNVMNSMNATILHARYGADDTKSHGLSIYAPSSGDDYLTSYGNLDLASSTRYASLLTRWYAGAADSTNALPVVNITLPEKDASVSGLYVSNGTASDSGGITLVQVRMDSDAWINATGTTSWNWSFNSSLYGHGVHDLIVKAYDNLGAIGYCSVHFNITSQKNLTMSLLYSTNDGTDFLGNAGSYWVRVENGANTNLSITMSVVGSNDDWYTAISDPSPVLGAFQYENIVLSYEIPYDADVLSWSNVTVTAAATGASASLDIQLQAVDTNWTFHFTDGWNLISLPLYNGSISHADELAAAIGDSCLQLVSRAANGTYVTYIPDVSPGADDFPFGLSDGVYVYIDGATDWTYYGNLPGDGNMVQVHKGYNLIGFPLIMDIDARSFLDKVGGNGREAESRAGSGYDSYIQAISPVSYDFTMSPGNGYYIWSEGDYLIVLNEVLPWFPESTYEEY